jgi:hypothetical protein
VIRGEEVRRFISGILYCTDDRHSLQGHAVVLKVIESYVRENVELMKKVARRVDPEGVTSISEVSWVSCGGFKLHS